MGRGAIVRVLRLMMALHTCGALAAVFPSIIVVWVSVHIWWDIVAVSMGGAIADISLAWMVHIMSIRVWCGILSMLVVMSLSFPRRWLQG